MKININNKYILHCKENETILDTILNHDYSHQYSCRVGRCNTCKVKLIEGKTSSIYSEVGLSKEEKNDGYILSCCRFANSDISLESRNFYEFSLIKPKIIPSQVIELEYKTKNTIQISLKIPKSFEFNYYAGQYIKIKYKGEHRSYSITKYNSKEKIITILCKLIPSGLLSEYFSKNAKIGDRLIILSPFGMSSFSNKKFTKIFFLATGVGISPIINFLNYSQNNYNLKNKKIILYWGNKIKKDFFYDFFTEKHNHNLIVKKCLSRDIIDQDFAKGYVQDNFLNDNKFLNDSVVYACGNENMINDLKINLIKQDFNMDYFFSDAFFDSGEQK